MFAYFLQVQLCWSIFYGIYFLLLSKETFFQVNRIYLILSLLLGLIIPLNILGIQSDVTFSVWLDPIVVNADRNGVIPQAISTAAYDWTNIIRYLYFAGVLFYAGRFIAGIWNLGRILQKSTSLKQNNWILVNTNGLNLSPFSFYKWIFIDLAKFDSQELEQVVRHEATHLRQAHTFDILLLEFLKSLFWWSPVIFWYKRSLGNQHEYLADEGVLKVSSAPAQYGKFLLQQVVAGNSVRLANHLTFSQLKKRIIMMTKTRSQRLSLLKYAIALPLLLLLTRVFADPDNRMMQQMETVSDDFDILQFNTPGKLETPVVTLPSDELIPENQPAEPEIQSDKQVVSTVMDTVPLLKMSESDELPFFKPGIDSLYRYLGNNIHYPSAAREAGIEGMVVVGFVVGLEGEISDIRITKGVNYPVDTISYVDEVTKLAGTHIVESASKGTLEAEALRVISNMPALWAPGRKSGKPVKVVYNLPIRFKLS
jgi:hypothetical protein